MPKISIIIPTLNRPDSLNECLKKIDACLSRENVNLEAVIVDSSDNDYSKVVSEKFQFSKYIKTVVRNRSLQRNYGIREASGDILAFLDDDCLVREDWLKNVLRSYKRSGTDAIGGVVLDKDQERSEFYGTEIIGKIFSSGLTIANFNSLISRIIETDWLPGGNMAFKRSLFLKIAGFDKECIGTASYEETDLCLRAKIAGAKIYFDPSIVVDHVRAKRADVDRNRNRIRGRYFASRNYTYFLLKNYGADIRKLFFIYIRETYWHVSYFLKKPTTYNFFGIFANIYGKLAGTSVALGYHFFTKRTERPLLGN